MCLHTHKRKIFKSIYLFYVSVRWCVLKELVHIVLCMHLIVCIVYTKYWQIA